MTKILTIALVTLGLSVVPNGGFCQTWKELGPSPISGGFNGRISAIACDPTDPNTIYIGGADGGVWKTSNGGGTWTPKTDGAQTSSVGAIAIDPTNPQTLYVGTGEANYANHSRYGLGVLKSIDGGATWTLLGTAPFAGKTISKLVIDPSNSQVLYASVAAAGGFPELAAAKGHPGRLGPYGVYKSTNGGVSWSLLGGGLPGEAATDLALNGSTPSTVYAAIGRPFGSTSNGVYKSVDSGVTWTKLAGGLPTANLGRISIACSSSDPQRLYALIVNRCDASGNNGSTLGAYKSINGGSTWTSIPVGSFQATYGWYLCAVAVQPTNADTAVFAGFDLLRTTNGGTSFSTVTAQHVDNHALAWDASGRLWLGCDGGVYRSTNNGTTWTNANTGFGACQFYAGISTSPSDNVTVLGGLQDNGTVQLNGTVWGNYIGGDGGYTCINPSTPSIRFAQYQGAGNLFRSTNSGATWSSSGSGVSTSDRTAFFSPVEVDPTNSNRVFLATHRLYRSTNGGTSWAAISADLSNGAGAVRALALSKSNPNTIWVATNDGNISRSQDGGLTFTKMLTSIPGWPRVTREVTIDPEDASTVFLAVSQFGTDQIRRTKDAGVTWQSLDGDLPDVPVNVVTIERFKGKTYLFAGTDDGLYRSMDDGATWTRFGNRLPRCAVIDIRISVSQNRIVVGTQGRGAWECPFVPSAPRGAKK
ncbi:MAG: hypothetical protein JNM34_10400 [Chthonomonadaceae bacterium]|nr:hypothetical protein [Chthonomonadaceae bacterium]